MRATVAIDDTTTTPSTPRMALRTHATAEMPPTLTVETPHALTSFSIITGRFVTAPP